MRGPLLATHLRCCPAGLAFKNLDAAALRSSFALLNGHYPERAAGIVMYRWG